MEIVLVVLGILLGVFGSIFVLKGFRKKQEYHIHSFLENMKSVGELVVFKAFTKEIVTTADHWLGNAGKKYLTWLMSEMKMAMIFQFEINFWYDLKSRDFQVKDAGEGKFMITMPQCLYNIGIKDLSFYDEQSGKFLDWLLPPLIGKALSKGFSEEDKNKLKDEALKQASSMADQLIKRLSSEIEKSAQQTMEMLAKSFGAESVSLDFSRSELVEESVTEVAEQQVAQA
jgi:hypothetical protein